MLKQKRGFTLLELLIAIVLVTGALFPLLSALGSVLLVSHDSESSIIALNLAQSQMEELKNTSFAGIVSSAKATVPNFPTFSREVVVSTPLTNLKDIRVFVYWRPSGSFESSISFESYVANY